MAGERLRGWCTCTNVCVHVYVCVSRGRPQRGRLRCKPPFLTLSLTHPRAHTLPLTTPRTRFVSQSRNIMLKTTRGRSAEASCVAKVGDFGLSVQIDPMETHMSNM